MTAQDLAVDRAVRRDKLAALLARQRRAFLAGGFPDLSTRRHRIAKGANQ